MNEHYNTQEREAYWTKKWVDDQLHATPDNTDHTETNEYVLDMFPYLSGTGLHLGHAKGYTASDVYSRMRTMQGKNVLHPMGYDAYGLPTEQFAMENGLHPEEVMGDCIKSFRASLQRLGFSYDWDREVNTCDPNYYKWTQWIFKRLFERGLASYEEAEVQWCPGLGTVLAQDEIEEDQDSPNFGLSKRGNHPVKKRKVNQWVLKITEYADRLIQDLDLVDWSSDQKQRQINHIGRSEGLDIDFDLPNGKILSVYTTKPETIYGVTFIVIGLHHPNIHDIVAPEQHEALATYIKESELREKLPPKEKAKLEKTGLPANISVIHPLTGKEIPIWVADYVEKFATCSVMGVPTGDDRDRDFADKYKLPSIDIYKSSHYQRKDGDPEGVLTDSGSLDGLTESEARVALIQELEEAGKGRQAVYYRMHDWIFSRQRFWGEPFPVIHRPDGSIALIDDADLPVILPEKVNYPTEEEQANATNSDEVKTILDRSIEWKQTPEGIRETNTMPGAAGSSWYFMRYTDPHNDQAFADKDKLDAWLPVDLYMGGSEHTTGHVLYARFWHKVLHDAGLVDSPEPFKKIVHQGLVMGEDGEKMSKSKGNAVSVDETIARYGSDILRVFTMSLGPYAKSARWDSESIVGIERWVKHVLDVFERIDASLVLDEELKRQLHACAKKVTEDTATLKFNTAISALQKFVNSDLKDKKTVPREVAETLCKLIAPYAPVLAEEAWCNMLGNEYSVHKTSWPEYDESLIATELLEIVVQINGKVRAKVQILKEDSQNEEIAAVQIQSNNKVQEILAGKTIHSQYFVPGKLINYVVK